MTLDDLPIARGVPSVSAAQMAEVDRITIDDLGIGVERLMESASFEVARAARALLGGSVAGKRIVGLIGSGNNGADTAGALRRLLNWGARVVAVVAVPEDRLRETSQRELAMLPATRELPDAELLLDGLLGYSARAAARGAIATFIDAANDTRCPILAVDLPSGLDPDSGRPLGPPPHQGPLPLGPVIKATATVTLACPKRGVVAPEAASFVGTLVLADIGIPTERSSGSASTPASCSRTVTCSA